VFFAGLTVVAIAVQLISLATKGTLNPVNYFSYFTIESNLIATGVLMPLVMLADWLITPPCARLRLSQGMIWLSFPLVWIVDTIIRGAPA
jgi:hypothetical protein